MPPTTASDLPGGAFRILRDAFFDSHGQAKDFHLRPKEQTQDDPFDEYVAERLAQGLPPGSEVQKASGPRITPDVVFLRPALCQKTARADLRADSTKIAGIEVKKLNRKATGKVARSTGLDYNSTPPSGTIRLHDAGGKPSDIKGFYLFVSL